MPSDIINLSKLLQPVSDVAICLLDKIERTGAYFLPAKDIKDAKGRAYSSIIDEIAARTDIDPIEKGAIILNYKKLIKEYMNQTDILKIALENLKDRAEPDKIEEDWLNNFFDRAKLVSDDKMKIIWGKILAEEANNAGSISKQLIHMGKT